jgi:fido (protein-threonine AMPylation protein)
MSDSLLSNLNSNHVPGSTPLDHDDIALLIPSLSTQGELNEFEEANIIEADAWALSKRVIKAQDPVTEPYIRELHKRMFNNTWKWAGIYRVKELMGVGVPHFQIRESNPGIAGRCPLLDRQ